MTTEAIEPRTIEALRSVVSELAHAVRTSTIAPERRMWSAEDCASYLGYSVSHFRQRIAPDPSFPAPAQVGTGPAGLRWKAVEVTEWVESRRVRKGSRR
jgi:predicted DNA-binding transcriptional regulator AlpA